MAEPLTVYDLEFYFDDGQMVSMRVQDGRDAIDDRDPTVYRVTIRDQPADSDIVETTLTIHRDKLKSVQCVKRLVKPESTQRRDTILEL